jgi:hypothetical protein
MIKRILTTCALLAVPVVAAAQQSMPPGFKSFDDSAPRETLPAAPLVFIAYSLAWIALAFYAFTLWRKLGKVEQDLVELRRIGKR